VRPAPGCATGGGAPSRHRPEWSSCRRFLGAGDPTYESLRAGLLERNGPDFPAHRAVLVEVTAVREIRSPAYTFGGAREDELAAELGTAVLAAAGVTPTRSTEVAERTTARGDCRRTASAQVGQWGTGGPWITEAFIRLPAGVRVGSGWLPARTPHEGRPSLGGARMSQHTIALITGGNRGLGRATALALAQAGTDVVFTYRSHKDEAAEVLDAITALGRAGVALELDTSRSDAFPAFAESLRDALRTTWDRDRFDFLVNNAGVAAVTPVGQTSVEAFDLLVDVHFKGVFFLTQTLLPLLVDGGRIVNLSTGLTRFVGEGWSVYASLKSAIETYTKYLAKELGPRGIAVNVIAPGPIGTDFGGGAMRDNEQLREQLASHAALGRVGVPEDIGGAIAALLSPGLRWVTAQRVEASGGTLL